MTEELMTSMPEKYAQLYSKVNSEYIRLVGNAIKRDALSGFQVKRINRMIAMGQDMDKLQKLLAKQSKKSQQEVIKLLEKVAKEEYAEAERLSELMKIKHIPFEDNTELQAHIKAVQKMTNDSFENLSNSTMLDTGITIGPNSQIVSAKDAYVKAVDFAIQATSSGYASPMSVIRKTLKSMAESGLKVATYESEAGNITYQSIEVAARRNVLDGMRGVAQAVQDDIGKQFGADAKEMSTHTTCAPDHIELQGHVYPLKEWEKIYGVTMGSAGGFVEDIDGFSYTIPRRGVGIWNCRHYGFSHIIGVSVPMYSKEQIDAMNKKNMDGYTDDAGVLGKVGKKYTLYETTQKLRNIESTTRKIKYEKLAYESVGDEVGIKKADRKLKDLSKKYGAACKALNTYGIQGDPARMAISK